MTRTTTILRRATPALAALALALPAAAQDDGVASFGSSGNAGMFGVDTDAETVEATMTPDTVDALASDIEAGTLPDIAWNAVSSVTKVEIIALDTLSGDASGIDAAVAAAGGPIATIRAAVTADPTLSAAIDEAGATPEDVIAAYGAAAGTVELVVEQGG